MSKSKNLVEIKEINLEAPELKEIEKSRADQIRETFLPMAKQLKDFEEQVISVQKEYDSAEVITPSLIAKAKRLRLDIAKIRVATGKVKDEEKKQYRVAANAIQGVHNVLVWAVSDQEKKLKKIEDHYAELERIRIEELQEERSRLIAPYVPEDYDRDFTSMEEDIWEAFFGKKKKDHEDKVEAEKRAQERQDLTDKRKALIFNNGFMFNGRTYTSHGVEVDISPGNDEDEKYWGKYFHDKIKLRDAAIEKKRLQEKEERRIAELRLEREKEVAKYESYKNPIGLDLGKITEENYQNIVEACKSDDKALQEKRVKELKIDERVKAWKTLKEFDLVEKSREDLAKMTLKGFEKLIKDLEEVEFNKRLEYEKEKEVEERKEKGDSEVWDEFTFCLKAFKKDFDFKSQESVNLKSKVDKKIDDILSLVDFYTTLKKDE
jgi:hypothetical protein